MSRPFKVFLFLIGVSVVIGMLDGCGILGFTYPKVVDNNPLDDPIDIVTITNQVLTLANGQSFSVADGFRWEDKLYDQQIELQSQPDGTIRFFGKRRHLICGTPWARLVTIRLIPVEIKRWTRAEVGMGTELRNNGQQSPAGDRLKAPPEE